MLKLFEGFGCHLVSMVSFGVKGHILLEQVPFSDPPVVADILGLTPSHPPFR